LAGAIKSNENCIIIYTDADSDKVLKVPQVGGSLSYLAPDMAGDGPDGPGGPYAMQCPGGQMDNGLGGCMCPGVTYMADNEAYWVQGGTTNTASDGC
jgi:hypothetical protein